MTDRSVRPMSGYGPPGTLSAGSGVTPKTDILPFVGHTVSYMAAKTGEWQMHQRVRLVEDLRDERGGDAHGKPQRRPVVLKQAVEQALEASRTIFAAHGHEPAIYCRDDQLTVDSDPFRLAQILADLLSSCIKQTAPGGTISLTVERDGDYAVISVCDAGIGTPPDYLKDVFGVSAYSRALGASNTFTVRLPANTTSASKTGAAIAAEPATTMKDAKARRILVVDDNSDAAALLAVLLELEGHEVQTAANGGDALRRAELFRPEVVLIDLEMPGIDGLDASRRIRARPWGSDVVIAALTGWGQEMDRRRAQAAGVDLHFVKPVDTTALLGVVARALNDGRRVNLP
jgi:CheY-like chemotaxis protein